MTFSVHILFGAAVGTSIGNPAIALPVALASHYMLDSLPHREYEIENIENIAAVGWRKAIPDILKISIDAVLGFMIVYLLTLNHQPLYALLLGFLGMLPDGVSFLNFLFPTNALLSRQWRFHKSIHINKIKKETAWGPGISYQILTALASAIVLLNI